MADHTYEPPRIEQRAPIANAMIGLGSGNGGPSAAFRSL
jgi:hypothetical protein